VTSVTVQAPAKINLSLGVGPPRDDGYHSLATVYHAVSLFDRVQASPAPAGEFSIDVAAYAGDGAEDGAGDGADPADSRATSLAGVPTGDDNLAVRAARLLADHTGVDAGAHLRLGKSIPVAGGLAGGSTDAAAALVACNVLWGTDLPPEDLQQLAARLGSDVPFCLVGGTATGSGRGEEVSPALVQGSYHWVLAVADDGLSTPAVYAEVDRLRAGSDVPEPKVPDALMNALRGGDAKALGPALTNDLEPAAVLLRPELGELLRLGEACGALGAMVSGSGPTCAFLANDEAHALDIGMGLASAGSCQGVHRVTGPVPGARVISARVVDA
jgi:4-diphosphocytidyl-2-C-methyl-D-erythritol kinase